MNPPEPTDPALDVELHGSPIASPARALSAGARLGEFVAEAVIGEGSVAVVYAATDRALAAPLAIAEYMPARLALRNDQAQVTSRTPAQATAFAKGLRAFIEETRTLARCDHPSLVRVVRLFEANATAYRVMPRYRARRLLDVRRDMNQPPDEESLRALLDALLGALGTFHQVGGCHGKVTPSNILLLDDNRPLLLAPGWAGRVIAGDQIDAPLTSGDPSFAPIEQVVEAEKPLPPSVDLYALAGVARYWISGQLPVPVLGMPRDARRETLADTVQRLRLTWPRLRYSDSLLDALDNALSIYPAERPQSVAQMRARLGTAPPPASAPVSAAGSAAPEINDEPPSPPAPAPQPAPPTPAAQDIDAAMAFAPDPDPLTTPGVADTEDSLPVQTSFAREVPAPRRSAMWSGAVLVLLALLLVGIYEFRQELPVERVFDTLGISRGAGAGDSSVVSAPAVGPVGPVTPPTATDIGATKPMPAEIAAADSPAGATESGSPATAPIAADAGGDKPMPTEPSAVESPAAVAQPPAPNPPPLRVAKQQAPRAPASPREECGARTQFSLYRCMQTQCSQRQWASHAQCERFRATDSVD